MDEFMQASIEAAKKGLSEGGIPIGSVLVIIRGRAALCMHARFGHAKHRDALQAERSAAQKVATVFRLASTIRSIESLSPDFCRHEKSRCSCRELCQPIEKICIRRLRMQADVHVRDLPPGETFDAPMRIAHLPQ